MVTEIDKSLLVDNNHNEVDGFSLFLNEAERQRKANPDINVFYTKKKEVTTKNGEKKETNFILCYENKNEGRLSVVFNNNNEWDFYFRQPGERGLGEAIAVMDAGGSKVTLLDENIKKMPLSFKNLVIDYQYNKEDLGIKLERPSQENFRINKFRNTDNGRDDR